MREAYYEESAKSNNSASEKKKYTLFKVLSIIFLVAAGILIYFSIFGVIGSIVVSSTGAARVIAIVWWVIFVLLVTGSGILFGRIKLRYNVSYDYLFVEDELRISKVFNEKKRKFLLTMKADHIMKIGYVERESYERTLSGLGKPKLYTPNHEPAEGKEFFYILYSDSMGKGVYVIECRTTMLEYLVLACGRNKLDLQ